MDWYLKVLRQYADFDGRARRTEFWMFNLFNLLILLALAGMMIILGSQSTLALIPMALMSLYWLAIAIPHLAVSVRRLHDVGYSGWMLFIGIVPILGGIWLLVLYCTDSQPGDNEYGPNPKEDII